METIHNLTLQDGHPHPLHSHPVYAIGDAPPQQFNLVGPSTGSTFQAGAVYESDEESLSSASELETNLEVSTGLLSLISPQLLLRTFDILQYKGDQAALMQVDRGTYQLLLPYLYENIVVDIGAFPQNMKKMGHMLSKFNKGRKQIRHVIFDSAGIDDKTRPPAAFHQLYWMFVQSLDPKDISTFLWPMEYAVAPELSRELWSNFGGLKAVQISAVSMSTEAKKVFKTIEGIRTIEELHLAPDNRNHLHRVSKLFEHHAIRRLVIDCRTYKVPTMGHLDPRDSNIVHDNLTCDIFKHAIPLYKGILHHKLTLHQLKLFKVNLFHCDKTWFRLLKPDTLIVLELDSCPWASRFVQRLASSQSALQRLKLYHTNDESHGDIEPATSIDTALSKYLMELAIKPCLRKTTAASKPGPKVQMSNLTHVDIKLRGRMMSSSQFFRTLLFHVAGLELLKLDVVPTKRDDPNQNPSYYAMSLLLTYCNTKRLKQLGLPWKALSLEKMIHINPYTLFLAAPDGDEKIGAHRIAEMVYQALIACHGKASRLNTVAVQVEDNKVQYFYNFHGKMVVKDYGRALKQTTHGDIKLVHREAHMDILETEALELSRGRL